MPIWKSYFDSLSRVFLPYWDIYIKSFLSNNPIPRALVGLCVLSFVLFMVRRFFFNER